jgi:mRNA-degrading endonuclease RelE of RelBE toxin-antitoxin system
LTAWTVELTAKARREYRLLDEGTKQAAVELLQDLAEEGPLMIPAIELRGNPDTWRVRFNGERYRMLYMVSRSRKRILVIRIRPRPTAYDGMKN